MLISDIYKPGDKCVILAGYGYTLCQMNDFRRAKQDIPCTVYAVQNGRIYVHLADGSAAYSNNSAIVKA